LNSYAISTPYGSGWHIDTTGNLGVNYVFFAYGSESFTIGAEGKVIVSGWFRLNDSLTTDLEQEGRLVMIYALDTSYPNIIKSALALNYTDGLNWVNKTVTIDGLTSGRTVMIGIGRPNLWSHDWHLTAEWASITVSVPSTTSVSESVYFLTVFMFALILVLLLLVALTYIRHRVSTESHTLQGGQGKDWSPWMGLIVAALGFLSFISLFGDAIGVDYFPVTGIDIIMGERLYSGALQPLPISLPVRLLMPLGETLAIVSGLSDSLCAITAKNIDSYKLLRKGTRLAIMLSGIMIVIGSVGALFQLALSHLRYHLTSGGSGIQIEFFLGFFIAVAPLITRRHGKSGE
jgi:hypothetical protein